MKANTITKDTIDKFFDGFDPMEHIIKIECGYEDENVSVIYRDDSGVKRVKKEGFRPFVWSSKQTARKLYGGNREELKVAMAKYHIGVKGLRTSRNDGTTPDRMTNGYNVLFYAKEPMSYNRFMKFFEKGGEPIYSDNDDKSYIAVSPVEQYMISTGKRQFKGYNDYNDLLRVEFDLETSGLDPQIDTIDQIGIRTNKGFEKIITVNGEGRQKNENEICAIREFFIILQNIKPDIITGHNVENFDWHFIDVRLTELGHGGLAEFSKPYFPKGVYKKKTQKVLKLGGEMEYYYPTIMWGFHLTDSLFAVRRAMAINSNIKSAGLKYITAYSGIAKKNRVYVPGKIINETWADTESEYAFNDENGRWFKVTEQLLTKDEYKRGADGNIVDVETGEKFEKVTGRYIVERYLLDDLWETDKVELQYNTTNYFVAKLLPVSYDKVCTMGTAAIWKYIMLAWCYEQGIAIPQLISSRKFTGGLSRLLKVGLVQNVVKLDYNSLYPSILLSWNIKADADIEDVMLMLLGYMLDQREHNKGLKKKYGKMGDTAKATFYDGLQAAQKVCCNGFFGSFGSGVVFPFSDMEAAEKTTTIGRQCLRLMIHHFKNLGYEPIVGDSFTGDTPLFIRYKDSGLIDIQPIERLIEGNNIEIDALGREYDYSDKPFDVLCRSGWVKPEYIYRHETPKDLYRVEDERSSVDITEDHSLFNDGGTKIKPEDITPETKLEYYENGRIFTDFNTLTENEKVASGWTWLLNATVEIKRKFIETYYRDKYNGDKLNRARISFILNCVNQNSK